MSIGLRIKQRRESLGMTQLELAEKLGYKSKSTINKIEKGVNEISQSKVLGFANALRTTPSYILGYDDADSQSNDEFIDYRFDDGSSITIISNNKDIMSKCNAWITKVNEFNFSDEELQELINYAVFILSKRK